MFFSLSTLLGDVLHWSSGHKDTLETDRVPVGETCVCPSR